MPTTLNVEYLMFNRCRGSNLFTFYVWLDFNIVHHQVKGVLEAFLRMPDDLQDAYLQLANKYDEHPSQWSEYSRRLLVIKQEQVQGSGLTALSEETANRVWQIQETNSFQNGVFLKIARFNHSCCPNAEFSWVQKTGRREVSNQSMKFCHTIQLLSFWSL